MAFVVALCRGVGVAVGCFLETGVVVAADAAAAVLCTVGVAVGICAGVAVAVWVGDGVAVGVAVRASGDAAAFSGPGTVVVASGDAMASGTGEPPPVAGPVGSSVGMAVGAPRAKPPPSRSESPASREAQLLARPPEFHRGRS